MCNAHLQFSAHGTFHSLTLSQKMGVRHRRDGTWSRFLSDSLAPVLLLSSQPSATCYGLTRPVYFVLALRSLCQTQLPSLSHGPPALNSSGTGRRGPGASVLTWFIPSFCSVRHSATVPQIGWNVANKAHSGCQTFVPASISPVFQNEGIVGICMCPASLVQTTLALYQQLFDKEINKIIRATPHQSH